MVRAVPVLALALAVVAACDRDPEQPRGNAWEPCTADKQCSEESLTCFEAWGASDVTACLPKCASGDTCAAAPASETGLPPVARCTATDTNAGRCIVDCSTDDNCPAGMLCFFDETYTLSTNLGVCAWPPV